MNREARMRPNKYIYDTYKEKVTNYIKCGFTRKDILSITPLSSYQLRELIKLINKETGLEIKRGANSRKDDVRQEIANGNTDVQDIAKKLGISVTTVYIYGRVGREHISHSDKYKSSKILQDLKDGLSTKEIMAKHNTTRQNVSRIKRKYIDGI